MTSKTERARQIATQLFDSMPYDELKTKIKEDVPCSRTLAHNAIAWVRRKKAEGTAQKPSVEIVHEEKKEPAFIEEPRERIEPIKPEEPKPIEQIEPMPVMEELEIFKDMLRGFYIMILSKKGLLGSKYGRDEEQCVQCSDQMFRWLYRRYGEELLKHDTILLVLSHGALLGGIGAEWLTDRRKKQEKETKKKPEKSSKES